MNKIHSKTSRANMLQHHESGPKLLNATCRCIFTYKMIFHTQNRNHIANHIYTQTMNRWISHKFSHQLLLPLGSRTHFRTSSLVDRTIGPRFVPILCPIDAIVCSWHQSLFGLFSFFSHHVNANSLALMVHEND